MLDYGMAKTVFNKKTVDAATAQKLGEEVLALVSGSLPLDLAKLKSLIERGANLEVRSENNSHTPLLKAASRGQEGAVEMLLDGGAEKYAKTPTDGASALFLGIAIANRGVVKQLLDHGVDPDHDTFKGGLSGLMWAANLGKREIVDELVEHGAKVKREHPIDNKTAADYAEKDHLRNHIIKLGERQEREKLETARMIAEQKAAAEKMAAVIIAADQGINHHGEIAAPVKATFRKRLPVAQLK